MSRENVFAAWKKLCDEDLENRVVIPSTAIFTLKQERDFSASAIQWWTGVLDSTQDPEDREEYARILIYYRTRELEFSRAINHLEEDECPTN